MSLTTTKRLVMRNIWPIFLLLSIPLDAYAYIGPGLGIGTIGVVLGVFLSIILALFAILWYPFKRLIKLLKRNKKKPANSKDESEAA